MVWDTAGQERLGGMRDGYYIQAHCAIMMFDVTSRTSYDRLEKWHRDLVRVCGNIPIVICGNKADSLFEAETFVKFYRQKQLMFFKISAKSNYNLDKPFLYLARQLLGDRKQEVAKHPSFPKLIMTAEQLSQLQEDLKAARACDLPPESDDDL
ncbi:GTP-binding nuclear protein Ran-like isoform X2 [Drosophila rhopaloa]|nr:GTP-binding nuclear protein Ran-like isoform X2 [Drosophila rhopaloa]